MTMKEKLFFYDTETTGLRHWKNGIHQISGIIVIDNQVIDKFNFKVQPNPVAIIEDEALSIAKVTRTDVMNYPVKEEVYQKIKALLSKYLTKDKNDRFFLAGFNNSAFDNDFLRAFFNQCGDNYFNKYFWNGSFDVFNMALYKLRERRPFMENFKLHTVAKELGLEVDDSKLHDAEYDIYLTYEMYKILTNG